MREPDFNLLARRLLKSGIAPRHAHRAVNEIRDHYDDLVDAAVEAAIDNGASSRGARHEAAHQLGSMDDLVSAMSTRRELKTWAFRYPLAAVMIYPLACLVVLPAAPVFAGIANASVIARWSASLLAAGLFTAALLLLLQLTILFG